MSHPPKKKKPARWAYLDELDGRPTDDTPVRSGFRKPAFWELCLYTAAAALWVYALLAILLERIGATGCFLLGPAILGLRRLLYEGLRKRRCKASVLGAVESLTRRRGLRRNARYPIIRFEANGQVYRIHGEKPCHPSTVGNEEWVRYDPANPTKGYIASDSRFKAALLLTAIMGFLGVAYLILEMS